MGSGLRVLNADGPELEHPTPGQNRPRVKPSLLLIHNNPIFLADGRLRVDRKFHEGMLNYGAHIRAPMTTLHPLAAAGHRIMDPVEVPLAELPYQVIGVHLNHRGQVLPSATAAVSAATAQASLVVGYGYGSGAIAKRQGKRYIAALEYDLPTQLIVTRSLAKDPLRSLVAQARCLQSWYGEMVPTMRAAHAIHCNGYPMHAQSAAYNTNRLLYLDSRMSRDMVITVDALRARLQGLRGRDGTMRRPLRLVYSGRYEPMKGSLDAVQAAVACQRMGLDVEMDTWGQGGLAPQMRAVAAMSAGRIRVHDTIAFPDLVQQTHAADVFVCCHIQGDPSCTYLESMGAGLPVAGYANAMWNAMAPDSRAGVISARNTPQALAQSIVDLVRKPMALEEASFAAQAFASAHAFEIEFERRTDAINAALALD
jgi:colanic acid/amylovoran biosynthesis glycosyltransferase